MDLSWTPLANEEHTRRLNNLFKRWEGTPYREGSKAPGAGVDCVRFNTGVLDSMERTIRERIWIPSDVCYHDLQKAWAASKELMQRYWPILVIKDGKTQPGDMLVSGPIEGGPGHSALVGVLENTIWQIAGPGTKVSMTGFGNICPKGFKIYKVLRIKDRSTRWSK